MKKFTVEVTHTINVYLDEAKLEPLMADFNQCISDFGTDDHAFERHAKHIARLASEGDDFDPGDFVEGYGIVKDAGISIAVDNYIECDLVDVRGA